MVGMRDKNNLARAGFAHFDRQDPEQYKREIPCYGYGMENCDPYQWDHDKHSNWGRMAGLS